MKDRSLRLLAEENSLVVPDKGLVVLCLYTFTGRPNMIKKLGKVKANNILKNDRIVSS